MQLVPSTDDKIRLPEPLRKIDSSSAARSLGVLDSMVSYLLSQAKGEEDHGYQTVFALDFDVIADVLENRVYSDVMKRCLNAARQPGFPKLILLPGTLIEVERYIRHQIRRLHRFRPAVRLTEKAQRRLPTEGVFADKRALRAKNLLESYPETNIALETLGQILTLCCATFSSLNIGAATKWVDRKESKSYERELKVWQKNNPYERNRTRQADKVDAENLAIVNKVNVEQASTKVSAALVTATRPVLDVARTQRLTDVQHPLVLELHQSLVQRYKTARSRIFFLDECKVEISQLQAGFDTFKYGGQDGFDIKRRELSHLMGILDRIASLDSSLGQLVRLLCNSSASAATNWFSTPQKSRNGTEHWTVVGINRAISTARSLLSRVLRNQDILTIIGGEWLPEVSLPQHKCIQHRLETKTPPASVTLDCYPEFYSMYWSTDLTIVDFLEVLAKMSRAKELRAVKPAVALQSNGEEQNLAVRFDEPLVDIDKLVVRSRIHMVYVSSENADFYFETPKPASFYEQEDANAANGCTCAIMASYGDNKLPSAFFEETCSCYLEKPDFESLFGKKIRPPNFEGSEGRQMIPKGS